MIGIDSQHRVNDRLSYSYTSGQEAGFLLVYVKYSSLDRVFVFQLHFNVATKDIWLCENPYFFFLFLCHFFLVFFVLFWSSGESCH